MHVRRPGPDDSRLQVRGEVTMPYPYERHSKDKTKPADPFAQAAEALRTIYRQILCRQQADEIWMDSLFVIGCYQRLQARNGPN
jgi:hypothetical protein